MEGNKVSSGVFQVMSDLCDKEGDKLYFPPLFPAFLFRKKVVLEYKLKKLRAEDKYRFKYIWERLSSVLLSVYCLKKLQHCIVVNVRRLRLVYSAVKYLLQLSKQALHLIGCPTRSILYCKKIGSFVDAFQRKM